MNEELAPDLPSSFTRQQELIAAHCPGVAEYIHTAPDREQAEAYVSEQCARFDRECESTILRNFLKDYVRRLFERRWSEP